MKIRKKSNTKLQEQDNANFISNNKIYDVISIEYDCYRIFNNLGEPALYPADIFDIVDNSIKSDWIMIKEKKEIIYFGPKEFSKGYFFEDFFNGNKIANSILIEYITKNHINLYCDIFT